MGFIKLLLAFAPWLAFNFSAGPPLLRLKIAIVVSLVLSVVCGYSGLRKKFILSWGTFLFFLVIFVGIVLFQNMWFVSNLDWLSYTVLAGLTWGSIIFKHPFVLQFASENAPKEKISDPHFIHHCRFMTFFWGYSFTLSLLVGIHKHFYHQNSHWPHAVILNTILAISFLFTVYYPKWVRRKASQA